MDNEDIRSHLIHAQAKIRLMGMGKPANHNYEVWHSNPDGSDRKVIKRFLSDEHKGKSPIQFEIILKSIDYVTGDPGDRSFLLGLKLC